MDITQPYADVKEKTCVLSHFMSYQSSGDFMNR